MTLKGNVTVAQYTAGDAFGKRDSAISDALIQIPLVDGMRAKLYEIQAGLSDFPEVECQLNHTFAPNVYIRTIHIPAGTCIVGKIHKHKHGNILSVGEVSVFTESGGLERIKAPLTMVSEAGTKRALYAHTDLVWSTIHSTNETDLSKLEDELIAPTYADYEEFLLKGNKMEKLEVTS